MSRRTDAARGFALALALACGAGCSKPAAQGVEVGHHRVRFVLPKGWEHLDHGRQQLFRNGETQISLVDLGPGTREAIANDIRTADSLWRAGYSRDAFQRIHQLRGPALRFATSDQRLAFWTPWTDVTYAPGVADSSTIGLAFEKLAERAEALNEVTPDRLVDYVLLGNSDTQRREIGSRERRTIHGADWMVVETWDRVSHLYPTRLAILVNHGYLLVLAIDRGVFEQTAPVFEALLASFEVAPGVPAAR